MIKFIDFTLNIISPGALFTAPKFESKEEALLRMNAWIEENEISVLNIETLMMPNLDLGVSDAKTEDTYYLTKGGQGQKDKWFQIFRVWYQG